MIEDNYAKVWISGIMLMCGSVGLGVMINDDTLNYNWAIFGFFGVFLLVLFFAYNMVQLKRTMG